MVDTRSTNSLSLSRHTSTCATPHKSFAANIIGHVTLTRYISLLSPATTWIHSKHIPDLKPVGKSTSVKFVFCIFFVP
ncbi:predicted protein [Arabidopsis lyrata subsp. lyrata]|uniref:Predicted protein n=1 Tax=Arabidopsis lyrata subsp. lyrata TaxID=81972 RepID=D7LKR8_ARALL|nr:predicted protein [Arabidopsis lyrata subsp. lyrata]